MKKLRFKILICLEFSSFYILAGRVVKYILYNIVNAYLIPYAPGYRFTKALTQNLNLRTDLKHEYNIKSLNYVQQNSSFQATFLIY